ncbi:importin subunit beta-like [Oscarella lobularis]|uniref:importin subunit beta-like n=1 Tax=Oscarella lobularis TaxID=121494 RepID=UPI0033141F06
MDLVQILEATISPDREILQQAEQYLRQAAESNLAAFLNSLADALASVERSDVVRMAAGLQFKNYITAKDPALKLQYQQRWLSIDAEVRSQIKAKVLGSLGTERRSPSSAAQCVAYIACAELPGALWPQLVPALLENVVADPQRSTESLKVASMETIGYVCEEVDQAVLSGYANELLTAVMQCMRKEEPSFDVRLAATRALLNSLEFTTENFEKESERNYIMEVICEATQCSDERVKVAALQTMVKVVSLYYQHMETYMGRALFPISIEAMKSPTDDVCLQGIEFWSSICDEETDLAIEAAEAAEGNFTPRQISKFYVKGALQFLLPILLVILTKQEEYDDEDEWNPCKASGVCLGLMAGCCGDDVVASVLPFVQGNITNENWKYRDAAIMAFGSILEGPSQKALEPIVIKAMPQLIKMLDDPSVVVQDTVAWTVGKVCDLMPEAALQESYVGPLLESLLQCLEKPPRVASNICWALSSLAEAAYDAAERKEDEPSTYSLSPVFATVLEKLLAVTDRGDGDQSNLRTAAYEAIMEFIKNSPKDCYPTVQATTLVILQKLQRVLQLASTNVGDGSAAQYQDLQSMLCATLQSILRKMVKEDAMKIADTVMEALLFMLNPSLGKAGGLHEDALMAVGSLIELLGADFRVYLEKFQPFLLSGLQNKESYLVCSAAVGVVGDLSRALGREMEPMCAQLMQQLAEILVDPNVHRSVKPQILSVFGDIALAIGTNFGAFLDVVMSVLLQASQAQVDKSDYEMLEYLNELRESCIEGYTGIVQGMTDSDKSAPNYEVLQSLYPHLPNIISFIEHIALDADHSDSNTAVCCGLLGDLCRIFNKQLKSLVENKPAITQLLAEGKDSKISRTKKLAMWAAREVRKVIT